MDFALPMRCCKMFHCQFFGIKKYHSSETSTNNDASAEKNEKITCVYHRYRGKLYFTFSKPWIQGLLPWGSSLLTLLAMADSILSMA